MILPKEIIGRHRIRNFDICRLYIEGLSAKEIKELRNIPFTVRRIEQIISENATFVNPRVAWPKSKRIHRLQRLAEKVQGRIHYTKGELEVLEQIRKEVEGEKGLTLQVGDTVINTPHAVIFSNITPEIKPVMVADECPQRQ